MSNFAGENGNIIYTEPEGALVYRGKLTLTSDYEDDSVGLCVSAHGGGKSVHVGLGDEADVQQFLYAAAVQAKLIEEGDPLILMKSLAMDEDAA